MFILYDFMFLLFTIICLPVYLLKGKFHPGFSRRLGLLPKDIDLDKPIWVHAVSVGEVMAVRKLVGELSNLYPDKKFVISTVTPTGNKIARGIAKETSFVTYLPLDLGFVVKKVIAKINPCVFIIAETEIWPNLISYLYKKKTPIIIVNSRISDRSFKGYASLKFLIRPILNKVNLFCVQTQADAERLKQLGVGSERIQVTGNMKFDTEDYSDFKKDYRDYRKTLCLGPQDKFLVAGSTHSGEEEIIVEVYKEALKEFPRLKLLIAPRHPERRRAVADIVTGSGLDYVFVSSLVAECSFGNKSPVFILDTVGELVNYYAISDLVFVGGSLVKKGGHNILEPAFLGKPVLFGPYMFNFRDIADLFLKDNAAIMVHSPQELRAAISKILTDADSATKLSEQARQVIRHNQGATLKNAQYIKDILGKTSYNEKR